jgi:pyruvate/2-oxoglutarate dehydrogenase complex dihydrolipoamide acyltransferase (E2) component
MAEQSLRIPQIGEGLQEARVVALLKEPGDLVARDEPIYQMETDKAVMDVESPAAGRIVRWLVEPDQLLPIGAEVLVLDTDADVASPAEPPSEGHAEPNGDMPPAPATLSALVVPHIGEGLQEARIVLLLKKPGEAVLRDEPIYQIETDKAVMDIESPFEGVIHSWSVREGDLVPIGSQIGFIQGAGDPGDFRSSAIVPTPLAASTAPAAAPSGPAGERRRDVPPKTRAYAISKGLREADLALVPATGKNLLPADIDGWIASRTKAPATRDGKKAFVEAVQSPQQRILSSRLVRGSQLVVPGMMSIVANWQPVEDLREEYRATGGEFQPSTFTMFAFAVAKAAAEHPLVRSTLVADSTVRTYVNLQLGIAVSRPGDELVVAVVEDADALDWQTFAAETRAKIGLARAGKDQANETVTLSITNMASYGIRDAMAVVVPPGVATIFLGEPYWGLSSDDPRKPGFMRCANVGMTLDHRLINGVGGAEFLNTIRRNIESIRELISL